MNNNIQVRREAARRNVLIQINTAAQLPNQVFLGDWDVFRFFESDRIVQAESFVPCIKEILRLENGETCCVLNLVQHENER